MVVPVFFGIIGLIGLMGNALVIIGKMLFHEKFSTNMLSVRLNFLFFLFILFLNSVVTANQQMRSTTNLLIINLAVADILFVIFCVPFTATDYVFTEWPFGDIWCKFVSSNFFITKYRNGIPRFVHLTNKL